MTQALPDGSRFDRVGLYVEDLEGVWEFYRDVIGLEERDRTDEHIALGSGSQTIVELIDAPGMPARPTSAAGLFHLAIRVPSREALGAAFERIQSTVGLDGASDHGFSEALYLSDPEGNGIEVYRDRPESDWPRTADGDLQTRTDPLALSALADESDGKAVVPPRTDLGHVHLEVTDLQRSLRFYREALGFDLRMRPAASAAFLASDQYHHHVAINTWNGRSTPLDGRGLAWLRLAVRNGHTLPEVRAQLRTAGAEVAQADEGFETHDPDRTAIRCVSAQNT